MIFDHLKTTGKGTGRGGDNGSRIIINEPGIYMLIGRSRKPEAVAAITA
jgi:prophage antirepressor-like protein